MKITVDFDGELRIQQGMSGSCIFLTISEQRELLRKLPKLIVRCTKKKVANDELWRQGKRK